MDGFQEWYTHAALVIARIIESIGIVVLVLGVGSTFVRYLRDRFFAGGQRQESYRSALGKDILLGLGRSLGAINERASACEVFRQLASDFHTDMRSDVREAMERERSRFGC